VTTERERTGIVGLGAIGGGIARSLLRAGFPCAAYDVDEERTRALQSAGAVARASAAAVARESDLLILAPFNVTQVEAILRQDGALEALPSGASLAVVSTIPPTEAKRLADLAAAQGHVLLDCPVSGGGQAAAEGRLTAMIGGPAAEIERHRPVWQAIFGRVFHVGEQAGAGSAVKLVNQTLYFAHLAALAEAVAFAERSGVALPTVLEVVSAAAGDSWVLRNRLPVVIDRTYRDQGSIEIAAKDLGSILQTAAALKVPMPLTALARQLYEMARAQHPEGCDDVALVALMEHLSRVGQG
jgi:3-hydroxyisobutyrate dehydrogenase